MTLKYKTKRTLAKLLKDTAGSMAMVWGVVGVGTVMTVGAAYDVNQVSKAKKVAQLAADNMALTASIAVDFDNDDRYEEGQAYSYSQLGGPADDFTDSMVGVVEYDIPDELDQSRDEEGNLMFDENGNPVFEKLLARATVSGNYTPAFIGALGVESIPFEATSDVGYAAREGKPASIFFVTDNSGSMWSRDGNNVRKIDGLKSSMVSFMNVLSGIQANQSNVFRTNLIPYSSYILNYLVVDPKWGQLTNSEIYSMTANGGTRSTSALTSVKSEFALENNIHYNANGDNDPLKFLVFMSDGSNNGAYQLQEQTCNMEQVWVGGSQEYWVDTYYWWNPRYYSYQWWFDHWVVHYPASDGHYEEQEVCDWETTWTSPENATSLTQCNSMKQSGVNIYSIAYNITDAGNSQDSHGTTLADLAIQFMKDCSSNTEVGGSYSDNGYYQYAENGADLQAVFDQIGQQIVKDVIRVKR